MRFKKWTTLGETQAIRNRPEARTLRVYTLAFSNSVSTIDINRGGNQSETLGRHRLGAKLLGERSAAVRLNMALSHLSRLDGLCSVGILDRVCVYVYINWEVARESLILLCTLFIFCSRIYTFEFARANNSMSLKKCLRLYLICTFLVRIIIVIITIL